MQIAIGAVGLLKKGPEAELVKEYCGRFQGIGRQLGFRGIRINEVEVSKSLPRGQRQTREAEQLLVPISAGAHAVCLEENGKEVTSKDLASLLARLRDNGTNETWFLIGGADGHGTPIKDRCKRAEFQAISLGRVTWPHMLVRVMLCEQLYRAVTILANHPYHRE